MKPYFSLPEKLAKQAHKQACDELNRKPRHLLDEGNPNHPMYDNTLFGHEITKFLLKQYK